MDRMAEIYGRIEVPQEFSNQMEAVITRLKEAREKHGSIISPKAFQ